MEPQHYKYINITRGIAILMVISVHTSQHVLGFNGILKKIASFGQMGVQLFFIASALTLCLSWKAREGSNTYAGFITRRFFRIAPIYFLGMILYFIMSYIDKSYLDGVFSSNFKYKAEDILSNLTFVHGFVKQANNSVVPGGWSIGAEFAFYAAFPFLITLILKGYNVTAIMIMLGVSFSWAAYSTYINHNYAINTFEYYMPLSQLVVFSFGIMLHKIIEIKHSVKLHYLLTIILVLVIFAFFLFISVRSGIVVWANLVFISWAFSAIIFFLKQISIKSEVLNNIGIASYSMYINHFLIVWFVLPYLTKITSQYLDDNVNFLLMFVMTVFLSYVMAAWTYKNIELRFIAIGKRLMS